MKLEDAKPSIIVSLLGLGSTWTLSIIWIQSLLGDEAKGFLFNKSAKVLLGNVMLHP